MHKGTRQEERLAAALDPARPYVRPDELSLATRLRQTLMLARELNFVDELGLMQGHWGEALERDLSFVLAEMASCPAQADDARVMALWPRLSLAQQQHYGRRLRQQLEGWREQLMWHEQDGGAIRLLQLLQAQMQSLEELASDAATDSRQLRRSYLLMARARQRLAQQASRLLDASLKSGQHEPAMGALLVAAQLIDQSRAPQHQFTQRLIQYYYQQQLGFVHEATALDRVHLVLERDPRQPRPVQLPRGACFVGGKNAKGQTLRYQAEQALTLSHLKVERLRALRLDHDPLVFPENRLGYATEARAFDVPAPSPEQAALPQAAAWPMLGGGSATHFDIARQGLAIASSLLSLREGEREISIALHLASPREPDETLPALLQQCMDAGSAATLSEALGRLFARWLCGREAIDAEPLRRLRQHARRILHRPKQRIAVDNPLSLIWGRKPLERSLVFDRVFRGLWQARLSSAQGWLELPEVYVSRDESGTAAGSGGGVLRLRMNLDAAAPPICACEPALHGEGWPSQPVLQLQLASQTRVFGCSLLQLLVLDHVRVDVEVRGLRELLLYNQLGRLDPSKPFQAFGPLPDNSSYLLFAHPELAAKPLSALSLQLRWAGLPSEGLAAHYQHYPQPGSHAPGARDWQAASFRVRAALLGGGQWHDAAGPALRLFADEGPVQTLELDSRDLQRLHQPLPGCNEALDYSLSSRQGFFRLQLDGPASAFGHALYPRLLGERLSLNARIKQTRLQLPLPAEPYTPRLETLTLNYRASQRINALPEGQARAEQLLQLCPFGLRQLQRDGPDQRPHLLPHWPLGAQLFIGLGGTPSSGLLSLLFQLQAERAGEPLQKPLPSWRWAVWAGQSWRELEDRRVLLDSTACMRRTGLVQLDLPEGLSTDCPEMGPNDKPLLWLRLSVSGDLSLLAPLQGVWAQAVSARRWRAPGEADEPSKALPAGSLQVLQPGVPGIVRITQALPSFELREAEDEARLRRRAAERLRHRGRAQTPWDIERLVLEAFPQVQQARCMPAPGPRQSAVLVLVPALPLGREIDGTEAPRLDGATLDAIERHVCERAAPGLRLVARNAAYDRIQVRCRLRLSHGMLGGERLRELQLALIDYLSPWRPGGVSSRFDWQIKADEIGAYLRAQSGVESVGELSLLQIVQSDAGRYRLRDSAVQRAQANASLTPSQPWSLALPTRKHLLELSEDTPPARAQRTGLSRLALGTSFIIGRGQA